VAEDPRLYVRIHADLAAQIAGGTLPPGARINIGAVANRYTVARETVQKAIKLLADDGLVTRYPGVGWIVD
jgi:DNA-binding GntR family transcriptional regulator